MPLSCAPSLLCAAVRCTSGLVAKLRSDAYTHTPMAAPHTVNSG